MRVGDWVIGRVRLAVHLESIGELRENAAGSETSRFIRNHRAQTILYFRRSFRTPLSWVGMRRTRALFSNESRGQSPRLVNGQNRNVNLPIAADSVSNGNERNKLGNEADNAREPRFLGLRESMGARFPPDVGNPHAPS